MYKLLITIQTRQSMNVQVVDFSTEMARDAAMSRLAAAGNDNICYFAVRL